MFHISHVPATENPFRSIHQSIVLSLISLNNTLPPTALPESLSKPPKDMSNIRHTPSFGHAPSPLHMHSHAKHKIATRTTQSKSHKILPPAYRHPFISFPSSPRWKLHTTYETVRTVPWPSLAISEQNRLSRSQKSAIHLYFLCAVCRIAVSRCSARSPDHHFFNSLWLFLKTKINTCAHRCSRALQRRIPTSRQSTHRFFFFLSGHSAWPRFSL